MKVDMHRGRGNIQYSILGRDTLSESVSSRVIWNFATQHPAYRANAARL
jgi:hypothetical protein